MYKQLEEYLKNAQWQEADQETDTLMLQILEKKPYQGLNKKDIKNFPSEKLLILDRLWTEYSQGKFGFSIQKQIWLKNSEVFNNFNLEISQEITEVIYKSFSHQLGWQSDNNWSQYNNGFASLENSKLGYFPRLSKIIVCVGNSQYSGILSGVRAGAILYVNLFSCEDL